MIVWVSTSQTCSVNILNIFKFQLACNALISRGKVDRPLCHLLQDDELLLNNFNALLTADDLLFLNNNDLGVTGPIEIVSAVKRVKIVQRGKTAPVIERYRLVAGGGRVHSYGLVSHGTLYMKDNQTC